LGLPPQHCQQQFHLALLELPVDRQYRTLGH